ncbi:hypothetical protein [Microbacterium sp. NPDC058389]|uniref:hypothetical protein n=1 Tax=Microbacterium sp. NPDC058389 TaxID=3346475 RepID=UPI00365E36B8
MTISTLALLIATSLAGCATSSSGSRHALYDSLDSLAADSTDIVVGTVQDSGIDGDATVATIEVENAPTNPSLGSNVDADAGTIEVGDVIEVRQQTDEKLSTGAQYLLYVTPTMLSGDAADQYYITGAVAGMYVRDGDVFQRVVPDSGDTLPETFSISE